MKSTRCILLHFIIIIIIYYYNTVTLTLLPCFISDMHVMNDSITAGYISAGNLTVH